VGGTHEGGDWGERVSDYRLVADLEAFIAEHRRCGAVSTGMTETESPRVWVACSCGARIERRA